MPAEVSAPLTKPRRATNHRVATVAAKVTSAGEASGTDLCLHMIRRDHGAALANEVARGTVVPPHRDGGQAQFIRRPVAEPALSSTANARSWALAHFVARSSGGMNVYYR